MSKNKKINAVIIGASGYTGAELVRLLAFHPNVEISALVAESNAGKKMAELYPHFSMLDLPATIALKKVKWKNVDVAFCCLPHGTSQQVITKLPKDIKIIDLSADFRLEDPKHYEKWYGHKHRAPKLQKEAVYALTELKRERIKKARIIANPGCYTTTSLLPLIPLLESGRIRPDSSIIIDAKSGITGAGRSAKTANLFAEVNENVKPYSIGGHRHVAEIEQELSKAANKDIIVTFTPQVVPMNRGIVATIYVDMHKKTDAAGLKEVLAEQYKNEYFVHVADGDYVPTARDVVGSNHAMMNVFADRVKGRAIIVSVTDNLLKGASGQAVQNMNLIFGLDEKTGLEQVALFP